MQIITGTPNADLAALQRANARKCIADAQFWLGRGDKYQARGARRNAQVWATLARRYSGWGFDMASRSYRIPPVVQS